jgi:hypothetical protein
MTTKDETRAELIMRTRGISAGALFTDVERDATRCLEDAVIKVAKEARRKIAAKPDETIAFLYRDVWLWSEPVTDEQPYLFLIHPCSPDTDDYDPSGIFPINTSYHRDEQ